MLRPASLLALPAVVGLALLACSSSSTGASPGGSDAGPADPATLPEIAASELGQPCSGFGTSPGDTVLFPSDGCPAGQCLVDARGKLTLYCSADCAVFRCPSGYLCEDTTLGGKRACFKDPDAPPAVVDAGAPVAPIDRKLPGYHANAAASTPAQIALSDYRDPTRASRDLVILVLNGSWSTYDRLMAQDVIPKSAAPRVTFVSVLGEGVSPGVAATADDFRQWHTAFPAMEKVLDPAFATYTVLLTAPVEAVPTLVPLDAKDLQRVAPEEAGASTTPAQLDAQVERWRKLLKPL